MRKSRLGETISAITESRIGRVALALITVGSLWLAACGSRQKVVVENADWGRDLCQYDGKPIVTDGFIRFNKVTKTNVKVGDIDVPVYSTKFDFYQEEPLPDVEPILIELSGSHKGFTALTRVQVTGDVNRFWLYNTDKCYIKASSIQALTSQTTP